MEARGLNARVYGGALVAVDHLNHSTANLSGQETACAAESPRQTRSRME